MELDERPSVEYGDIGGIDKQIKELIIVLPMTHQKIDIKPPKGLLMHGSLGTGDTTVPVSLRPKPLSLN